MVEVLAWLVIRSMGAGTDASSDSVSVVTVSVVVEDALLACSRLSCRPLSSSFCTKGFEGGAKCNCFS